MPRARVGQIDLEYETRGDRADPTVLLICGWGSQLISWHPEFIGRFVDRRLHAVCFDNRDAGLSTRIEDGSTYTLEDMAADAVGLLDVLGVDRAHLVGMSMGGMIAQSVAIHWPERVLTLTSLCATTGAPGVGGVDPSLAELLTRGAGATREERITNSVESSRAIWGDTPEFPFDAEFAHRRAEAFHDRSWYPVGRLRHALAIQASGDRTAALRKLGLPALVVHGDCDPLVHVSGGEATATAIPGAEWLLIKGMGHHLGEPMWDRFFDAFDRLLQNRPLLGALVPESGTERAQDHQSKDA